eukprot:6195591-Pleurochrysis_carterae.AAC.1
MPDHERMRVGPKADMKCHKRRNKKTGDTRGCVCSDQMTPSTSQCLSLRKVRRRRWPQRTREAHQALKALLAAASSFGSGSERAQCVRRLIAGYASATAKDRKGGAGLDGGGGVSARG